MTLAVVLVLAAPLPTVASETYQPDLRRIRAGLGEAPREAGAPGRVTATVSTVLAPRADSPQPAAVVRKPADSVWNGILIGAAVGGGGGYLWARNQCGSNDDECFFIAAPVGIIVGAGIGAAVGGLLDAFNR